MILSDVRAVLEKECGIPYLDSVTVCGCDEVGRGAFAGPLVAAAVVLPATFFHPLVVDSKKIPEQRRDAVADIIRESALSWSVEEIDASTIDEIGVGRANEIAFERLLESVVADYYLLDGLLRLRTAIPYRSVVKGDAKVPAIAAASVLAKTHRDALMRRLHDDSPEYGWRANKGYGSAEHRAAIELHGMRTHHRRSFIHDLPATAAPPAAASSSR